MVLPTSSASLAIASRKYFFILMSLCRLSIPSAPLPIISILHSSIHHPPLLHGSYLLCQKECVCTVHVGMSCDLWQALTIEGQHKKGWTWVWCSGDIAVRIRTGAALREGTMPEKEDA